MVMTPSEAVSVEFGTWQQGGVEPETPVLVKIKPASANVTAVLDYESHSTSKSAHDVERLRTRREMVADNFEPRMKASIRRHSFDGTKEDVAHRAGKRASDDFSHRVTLAEVTNFQDTSEAGMEMTTTMVMMPSQNPTSTTTDSLEREMQRETDYPELGLEEEDPSEVRKANRRTVGRRQRRNNVIAKLREDLQAQQESYDEAEKIARNAERMASEVVQHSNIQLALMKEALEDAVKAENFAIEGWKISDETVSQLLSLLREREKLWARAMWKYAYRAICHMNAKEEEESPYYPMHEETTHGRGRERVPSRVTRKKASKKLKKLQRNLDDLLERMESAMLNMQP